MFDPSFEQLATVSTILHHRLYPKHLALLCFQDMCWDHFAFPSEFDQCQRHKDKDLEEVLELLEVLLMHPWMWWLVRDLRLCSNSQNCVHLAQNIQELPPSGRAESIGGLEHSLHLHRSLQNKGAYFVHLMVQSCYPKAASPHHKLDHSSNPFVGSLSHPCILELLLPHLSACIWVLVHNLCHHHSPPDTVSCLELRPGHDCYQNDVAHIQLALGSLGHLPLPSGEGCLALQTPAIEAKSKRTSAWLSLLRSWRVQDAELFTVAAGRIWNMNQRWTKSQNARLVASLAPTQ